MRLLLLAVTLLALAAPAAHAYRKLPYPLPPVPHNPADRLASQPILKPYSVCYKPNGKKRKRFDPTAAHQDHIHIGMTKAGAKGRTSFWS